MNLHLETFSCRTILLVLSFWDYAGVRDENPYLFVMGTDGEGHSQGSKDIEYVVQYEITCKACSNMQTH